MKKSLVSMLSLAIFFTMTLVQDKARGEEFWDDTLHLGGKIENFTGIRTEDREWQDMGVVDAKNESGDLSRCRNTLQVEAEWSMTSDFVLHAIGRGVYEAKYSLDDDLYTSKEDAADLKALPNGNKMEMNGELREFYFKYSPGNFHITAGKQQIVWGESDALRMSDIINPLDMSWNYVFADWEDIRVPLWMIDVKYNIPSNNNLSIEAVWNPENFEPNQFAPYGDNYYIFGDAPTLTGILPPGMNFREIFFDAMTQAKDRGEGKNSLRNGAGGVRLGGIFGGNWDVHLYDYYQPAQSPIATLDQSIMFTDPHMGLRFEYPYVNTVGATFNVFNNMLGTVFRGECGYITDEPFTKYVALPLPGMTGPSSQIVKKDSFSYMLGFDRPTMIPFLNSLKSFFISGQIFQKYIIDADDETGLATGLGEDGDDDHNFIGTLLINTEYWDAKLKPEILVAHDFTGKNGFCKPKISYQPTYDWDITLGYISVWGSNYNSGTFGPVKDTDEVFLKLAYKF